MNRNLINRILKKANNPNLLNELTTSLSFTDLQSFLLEVYREKVSRLQPKDLMAQYASNRFVKPAQIEPAKLMDFEKMAFLILPDSFELVELSPVCPLGTSSVVAPVDQNNVVVTIRNSEVCSDPTNVLALEAATRRKSNLRKGSKKQQTVKLCASHRVVRAQMFDEAAAFPHFKLLSLCTAGKDEGSFNFELESLKVHISYYINIFKTAGENNFQINQVRVVFFIIENQIVNKVINFLLDELIQKFPGIKFEVDEESNSGAGYYKLLRFHIYATDREETEYFLVDGGFTDWTQKLLSNKKERLLTSGLGSERFVYCFAT